MTRRPAVTLVLLLAPLSVLAQDLPSDSQEVEIRAAVASYVDAFNRHDAGALAAHWSPEAVYLSRSSGEEISGREAMEKEFAALFAEQPEIKLEVATVAVQFISPNIAVERGTAGILRGDREPEESKYTAVYLKRDDKWLLDRITEETIQANSASEQLKQLEWLIGDWSDQNGEDSVQIKCNWTSKNSYITRAYTVSSGGEIQTSGLQIIGWDPQQQTIRSWLFDSEGGFVSGTWTQKNDRWFVQSAATLPDGGAGSFTGVFRPIDGDSYGWQKINQILDGEILPNLEELIFTRQ